MKKVLFKHSELSELWLMTHCWLGARRDKYAHFMQIFKSDIFDLLELQINTK